MWVDKVLAFTLCKVQNIARTAKKAVQGPMLFKRWRISKTRFDRSRSGPLFRP